LVRLRQTAGEKGASGWRWLEGEDAGEKDEIGKEDTKEKRNKRKRKTRGNSEKRGKIKNEEMGYIFNLILGWSVSWYIMGRRESSG